MKKSLLIALSIMASFAFAQDKCLDLCASCMNNDKEDVCAKVETLCKCSNILENLSQELMATDTNVIDTVQSETALDTAVETPKDTVASDSVEQSQPEQVATAPDPEQETTAPEDKPKDRIFYFGLSLGFEQFQEFTVANYDVLEAEETLEHIGVNFGFLLRWYLLKSVSFQTGLNAIYHHGHYDVEDSHLKIGWEAYYYNHDISIDYHTIMAEVPLTFRFGIPFVISPYVSFSIHVRKPIYAWVNYEADFRWQLGEDYSYNGRSDSYDDCSGTDGTFSENDWEFLGYLGFGLEVTRHLSVQWQMLLVDAVTYTDEILNYKLLTDTWRVNLDIAF